MRGCFGLIHSRVDAMVAPDNVRPFGNFINGDSGTFPLGESQAAPTIFLLGDSHAGVLRHGLDAALRHRRLAGASVTESAANMTELSSKQCQKALRELRRHPDISKVVLAQRWKRKAYDWPWEELVQFALHIQEMGKTLYILTDVPAIAIYNEEMMPRVAMFAPRRMEAGWDGYYSQEDYDRQQGEINRQLQAVCDRTGAVLVPLHLMLKQDDERYKLFELRDGRHVALYRDGSHLSVEGSLKAGEFLVPALCP